jgi:hypothetical protein
LTLPDPPVVRRGASGSFYDKGVEGASHHAVIPNVNRIDNLREVWVIRQPCRSHRRLISVAISGGCGLIRLLHDDRQQTKPDKKKRQ